MKNISVGEIEKIQKGKYSKNVSETLELIEENISNAELSLKWIASSKIFMSMDYLGRLFRNETGMAFSQYVLKRRIEYAKNLLVSEPDIKIYTVAYKSGFGDNSQHFADMFKKHTGVTPREFQKNNTCEN